MNTQFLENEFWYGGIVHQGVQMPISAEDKLTVKLTVGNGIPDQYYLCFFQIKADIFTVKSRLT